MISKISILGCGWLGLPLGEFLVQKGYSVSGSTTRVEKFPELEKAGINPYRINLPGDFEEADFTKFLESDLLILNVPPGRGRENPIEIHQQEINKVVEFLLKSPVKQVIFISSTGVYPNTNTTTTENDPTRPTRSSGKALVVVEDLLKEHSEFETTILRMAGLVGGERKAGRFLAGKKEVKNGEAPINLVHREDCIAIIYQIIQQQQWGKLYNVCTDEHPKRKEFYIHQAQKEGLTPPTFSKNDDLSFKIISNQKLKKELDYTFIHPDPMKF